MHDSLISNTFIVSDTDSDTDNESAVLISFSTSGSQCMVMITAVGLSNKYLNIMFRNVISFTTIEWFLKTSDNGSVADYSVCF